jgi:hypothetical protein
VISADGGLETLPPDTMVQPGISATEAAYRCCQELQKREAEAGDSSLRPLPGEGGGGVG